MHQEPNNQDRPVSLEEIRGFMKRGRPVLYDQGVVPLRSTSVTISTVLAQLGLVGRSQGVYVGGTRFVDMFGVTDQLLDHYITEAERKRERTWIRWFNHDKRWIKRRFIRYSEYLTLFEPVKIPKDISLPEIKKHFYTTYPAYEYFGITNEQDRLRVCKVIAPDRRRYFELFLANNSSTTKHFFFVATGKSQ